MKVVEVFPIKGNTGLAAKSLVMLSDKVWFAEPINGNYLSTPAKVLVDEIAHQWNFYHAHYPGYLSEGISTYTDELFVESIKGEKALKRVIDKYRAQYIWIVDMIGKIKKKRDQGLDLAAAARSLNKKASEIAPYWHFAQYKELPISDPKVFNSLYFLKGAVALHALRKKVGMKNSCRGLNWLLENRTANTICLFSKKVLKKLPARI